MLQGITDVVVGTVGEIAKALVDLVKEPEEPLHLLPHSRDLFLHCIYHGLFAARHGDVHWASV